MPRLPPSEAAKPRLGRDAPALYVLAVSIIAAPELLGGVYPWGALSIAALNLLALALTLWTHPVRGVRASPLSLAMILALAWTTLQALPLPCAVVAHIAPESVQELQRAYAMIGASAPQWCSLSRDASATREEIVKGLAIVCGFLAAAVLAQRGHRRFICCAVAASGALLATVGLAHAFFGAERVFGIYAALDVRDARFVAPIMNLNSLGGFLAMCAPLLVGLTFALPQTHWRLLLLLGTGLVTACTLMTGSRGAIGALGLSFALLAALAWRARLANTASPRRDVRLWAERLGLPLAIAAVSIIGVSVWSDDVIHEFRAGDWDKLRIIERVFVFAARHPWLGVGRGAFGNAFVSVSAGPTRFDYAENFVAQWASEWGMPLTIVLLAALVQALFHALRRARSLERAAPIAGLLALAAQGLVDVGLELVGISAVAAVLLGTITANRRPSSLRQPAQRGHARAAIAGVSLCATLLVALAVPVMRDHAVYLRTQLEERLSARDRAGFRTVLRHAVTAHPSEPAIALIAASESLQNRDRDAGRWINRAMQLAPGWAGPHLLATEWLWNAGRHDQALLELGLAMRIDPFGSNGWIAPLAAAAPERVAQLIPPGPERNKLLELVARCVPPNSSAAVRIDEIILREFPNDGVALLRRAARDLAAGNAGLAAEQAARAAAHVPELVVDATLLQVRALRAAGKHAAALAALAEAERRATDPSPLVRLEAEIAAERGEREASLAAIAKLRSLAGGSADQIAAAFLLEAQVQRKFGNHAAALRAYDQAYGINTDTGALSGIAEMAELLGDKPRAAWAYGMMCDLGASADACARRTGLITAKGAESPDKAAQPIGR